MRQFLRDISITFFAALIFLVLVEWVIRFFPNNYSAKYNYVTEHHDDIKTLLMGHSQFEYSFNPAVLGDSTYDFAISARTLYFDIKLAEKLLPTMENVETIIYPLHYNLHTVNGMELMQQILPNIAFHYYKYMGIKYDSMPEGVWYRSALLSDMFSYFKLHSTDSIPSLGYYAMKYVWDGKQKEGNPPNQPNTAICTRQLAELAKICHIHDVRLIVVTPPFPDAYIEEMTEEGIENIQHVVEAASRVHPFEFKSYLNDVAFRNDSLYMDWNHLNHRGATLFAERVKKDFGL